MQTIAQKIDDAKRTQILNIKNSLLTDDGRTPKFSGYYIYQAMPFQNMIDELRFR